MQKKTKKQRRRRRRKKKRVGPFLPVQATLLAPLLVAFLAERAGSSAFSASVEHLWSSTTTTSRRGLLLFVSRHACLAFLFTGARPNKQTRTVKSRNAWRLFFTTKDTNLSIDLSIYLSIYLSICAWIFFWTSPGRSERRRE